MISLTIADDDIRAGVLAFARRLDIHDERAVAMALARVTRQGSQGDAADAVADACRFLSSWRRHPSNAVRFSATLI